MYVKLSYTLTSDAPVFPGNPKALEIEPFTRLSKGEIANQSRITIFNHDGTHFDGPQHFNPDSAVDVSALDINRFIFHAPVIVDLEGKVQSKIFPCDIEPFASAIARADFLLIRTGHSRFRNQDHQTYAQEGPVFSPEFATYLIKHCDSLVGVGIDCISAGSVKFPDDAVKVHQILNGMNAAGRYLFILEDIYLPGDLKTLKKLFMIPWFMAGVDSLPATVFGEI